MSFSFDISDELRKTLDKLARKDKILAIAVRKKITQIVKFDEGFIDRHFKNLRHDLSDFKRVHIGSFVLLFKVKGNTIIFEKFVHHDEAYSR